MRGRNKKRLRAGSVALLGISLGAVGCQARGPLLSLDEGTRPRLLASRDAATIVTESAAATPVSLELAAVAPASQQVQSAERTDKRPILARLLRPTAAREPIAATPSAVVSQAAPVHGGTSSSGVASNWSALQREGEAAPQSVAAARWQNTTPQKDVTPPPLDLPTKVKPTPEPGLLHPPRTVPPEAGQETGPSVIESPIMGHGLPTAFGYKAPNEVGRISLPTYVIDPPDILLVETLDAPEAIQPIKGQHLVRPDGTIGLGVYGAVYVAGMTLEEAREAVAQAITRRLDPEVLAEMRKKKTEPKARNINVDVIAYNSKVYYVITDGGGFGEQVRRFPVTGSETVLDAISHIDGLPAVASKKKIWVARRSHGDHGGPQILPVNWIAITQGAHPATNFQVMPGDRIYVHSQGLIRADTMIGKVLAPIERLFGGALLGSSTVNSIQGRGLGFNNPGVR